jgi:hypothetical protein
MGEYEAREEKLEKEAAQRIEAVRRDAEDRILGMEEALKAKEKLIREGGEFWRQKQAELDEQHAGLNRKINAFNEDIYAQKRALSERENALNAEQLVREKAVSARMAEIEKLKVELTRTIVEYKQRK